MPPRGPSLPSSPAGSPAPTIANSIVREREQPITLRPAPGHPTSHKTFLRVYLHRQTLLNLDLKPGELCHISVPSAGLPAPNDDEMVQDLYPGIAWLTTDGQLGGGRAQVSEAWRATSGTSLETKGLRLGRYIGENGVAAEVVMSEMEDAESTVGWRKEGEGWKYVLENALFEAKFVFEGMPSFLLEYKGVKRHFKVDKVVASTKQALRVSQNSSRVISAYNITTETSVTLISLTDPTVPQTSIPKPETKVDKVVSPPSQPQADAPRNAAAPLPTFSQIGGLAPQLTKLKSLALSTLRHSHIFTALKLTPFRGILLYGPPGTGKSLIMRCLPGTLSPYLSRPLSTYTITGSVVGKYLGESEASIRKIFKEAKENQPSIIFIDEVDSLAPKRREDDGRIVTTLMTELDDLGDGGTLVIAATSSPNGVDEGLRRPGRLDREIDIPRPDVKSREDILTLMMSEIRKGWLLPSEDIAKQPSELNQDYLVVNGTEVTSAEQLEGTPSLPTPDPVIKSLAFQTHGFVGADLEALIRGAVLSAFSRLSDPLSLPTTPTKPTEEPPLILLQSDLETALKDVRPTAMREIFLDTPNVRWSDIGGQTEIKQRLREAVEWPLLHPEVFTRLGCSPRKGLLLYGPPGCSKTLIAKALATEAGLNFMPVKGPELLNMYVGESERAVREVFRKARAASPSIIFFDEIDALGSNRKGTSGNGVNVLTALLNEMDGIEALRGVIVLAATNRPELLDPALLRPGRLDTILYVSPPDLPARREILKIKTRKMCVAEDVDLERLAVETEGYSGAELVHMCDEATHYAMRESLDIERISWVHFEKAMGSMVKQITEEVTRFYEEWSVGGVRKI